MPGVEGSDLVDERPADGFHASTSHFADVGEDGRIAGDEGYDEGYGGADGEEGDEEPMRDGPCTGCEGGEAQVEEND